jgi:hypothetical protein
MIQQHIARKASCIRDSHAARVWHTSLRISVAKQTFSLFANTLRRSRPFPKRAKTVMIVLLCSQGLGYRLSLALRRSFVYRLCAGIFRA